jgi:hypothetical protein
LAAAAAAALTNAIQSSKGKNTKCEVLKIKDNVVTRINKKMYQIFKGTFTFIHLKVKLTIFTRQINMLSNLIIQVLIGL